MKETNNEFSESKNHKISCQLIKNNLSKTLMWHDSNLLSQNIQLTKNRIKHILKDFKEEKYPIDSQILLDISNITINFDTE